MGTARLYKFPLDLDSNSEEYPHRITFQSLKSRANSPTPAPGGMVALYLPPEALKAAYSQSYGDVDMGSIGIALAGVDRAAAQNIVGAGMSGDMGGMISALKGAKGTSGNIGQSLIAATAKETIGKLKKKMICTLGAKRRHENERVRKTGKMTNTEAPTHTLA